MRGFLMRHPHIPRDRFPEELRGLPVGEWTDGELLYHVRTPWAGNPTSRLVRDECRSRNLL